MSAKPKFTNARKHQQSHLFKPEIINGEGIFWAFLKAFACLEISRERKVQVPESFENFCCAKTGRELRVKRKPS